MEGGDGLGCGWAVHAGPEKTAVQISERVGLFSRVEGVPGKVHSNGVP